MTDEDREMFAYLRNELDKGYNYTEWEFKYLKHMGQIYDGSGEKFTGGMRYSLVNLYKQVQLAKKNAQATGTPS